MAGCKPRAERDVRFARSAAADRDNILATNDEFLHHKVRVRLGFFALRRIVFGGGADRIGVNADRRHHGEGEHHQRGVTAPSMPRARLVVIEPSGNSLNDIHPFLNDPQLLSVLPNVITGLAEIPPPFFPAGVL